MQLLYYQAPLSAVILLLLIPVFEPVSTTITVHWTAAVVVSCQHTLTSIWHCGWQHMLVLYCHLHYSYSHFYLLVVESQCIQKAVSTNSNTYIIQGDKKISMHLMITIWLSGAQRFLDHPVHYAVSLHVPLYFLVIFFLTPENLVLFHCQNSFGAIVGLFQFLRVFVCLFHLFFFSLFLSLF